MEEDRSTSRSKHAGESGSDNNAVAGERIVFTIPEIAALLGVDRATVYRWIQRGDIPVVRMGASRLFVPKRPFLEQFGITEQVNVSS